ncbi:MAG TPA: MFS transporter [Candidatus Angelobacter sp.]|nr:MFS transporter [Candidatus Angelobacter sp.]
MSRHTFRGFIVFLIIWLGQLVSQVGSGLTTFALGVWIYMQTGSVSRFAIVFLAGSVPAMLIYPFASALVDRWNRRSVMIACNSALALNSLVLIGLFWSGRLAIWHMYTAVAFASLVNAFNWPAYSTIVPLLVEKKDFGRANGMMQVAEGVAQLIAPVVAGILIVTIHIRGVLLIDCATFLFAIVTLLIVRVPAVSHAEGDAPKSLLREAAYGWSYIASRAGLLGLMMLFAFINFQTGVIEVLAQPLILSFASPAVMGRALSIAGSGVLVGSVIMSIWGSPRRLMLGILGFYLLESLAFMLVGWRPSLVPATGFAFFAFFCLPIVNGSYSTLLNMKVALGAQARVFGASRMMTSLTQPMGYLLAGPLADKVFGPWMAVGGPLSGNVGKILGVGPGRGIGLLFVVMGALGIAVTVAGYFYKPLRMLESDLPDIASDKPSAIEMDREPEGRLEALVPNK